MSHTVLATLLILGELAAYSQSFGPYVVNRTFALPRGALGDLAYADGFLYSSDYGYAYIHKQDPNTGQVLQNWAPLGTIQQLPTGLAWDGSNLWMAIRDERRICKLNLPATGNGSVASSFGVPTSPGLTGWPMDLAYANGYFYYPEYQGPIHKIDATTGVQVGTIPSPSGTVYGLTFDGQNLLASEGLRDTLWVVSPQDGTILDTWQTGVSGIQGLAYDLTTHSLYMGNYTTVTVALMVPEPTTQAIFAALFLSLVSFSGFQLRRQL
jgi:hypothetical protein